MKDDNAYPILHPNGEVYYGLTKQELAAIYLKVTRPDLPDWLNEMIEESLRNDYAKAAIETLGWHGRTKKEVAAHCFAVADAMIEEGRKK